MQNPSNNTPRKKENPIDQLCIFAVECLQDFVVVWFLGIWVFFKLFYKKPKLLAFASMAIFLSLYFLILNDWHAWFLHQIDPTLFSTPFMQHFYKKQSFWLQYGATALILISPLIIWLGFKLRFNRTYYMKKFGSVGLTNKLGDTPALIEKTRIDKHKTRLRFDSKSVGLGRFQIKKDDLEATFGQTIEAIEYGKNQKEIIITLTRNRIDKKVAYSDLIKKKKLPDNSFYLGQSTQGILTQSIIDLPHLLIAGTTGAGKSVFFKQALLGLLQSSKYMQMYLIDLKGGLEMADFKDAPNVQIVKDMRSAVAVLLKVKKEMEARFSYLEANGKKIINPLFDDKPRIIVAVDESSVLYMKRHKDDPEYNTAIMARSLTDDIAKLSRAAAIHLILATQKVSKETIDTTIQENISGRMCFKANTPEGSLRVLGTTEAHDLPDIKGRGIWSLGNKSVVVQAPYITETEIKEYCELLKEKIKVPITQNDDKSASLNPILASDIE